ncbi:MAG: signal peptidase I [bacterium]|nr:signal peptidase I [bacterium]
MFSRLGVFFLDILQTVLLAVAIFMLAYLFLTQPHKVDGHSMDPNFFDGEYLLSDKLSYRLGEPKRGDVIVFNAPIDRQKDFIKRIIALPGDTVMLKDGKVYINGELYPEPYLPEDTLTTPGASLTNGVSRITQEDEYIVFGDNRSNSYDSRSWGPIKRRDIIGRAWFVYWPPKLIGVIPR